MFALPAMGAIIVPLNTRLAPAEIAFILQDSGATALLLDDTFAGLPGQLKDLAAVTSLVHIGEAPTPPGMIAYATLLAAVPVLTRLIAMVVATPPRFRTVNLSMMVVAPVDVYCVVCAFDATMGSMMTVGVTAIWDS